MDVLRLAKEINSQVLTKTSLILGLGEEQVEVEEAMIDLIKNNVDILTFGQYLRPTPNHYPVEKWVTPKEFQEYREIGLAKGFLEVVSGPMIKMTLQLVIMLPFFIFKLLDGMAN